MITRNRLVSGLFYAIILAGHIKLIRLSMYEVPPSRTERILCTTTFPTLYFPLADCQRKIRCCCLIFACLLFISLKSTSSAHFCSCTGAIFLQIFSSLTNFPQISHEYSRHTQVRYGKGPVLKPEQNL